MSTFVYNQLKTRYILYYTIYYEVFVNFELSKRNLGATGIRGVAIYVKDHVSAREVSFNSDFKDHVWVEIGDGARVPALRVYI